MFFINNLEADIEKEMEKYKTELHEKTAILKTSLSIYAKEQDIAYQRIDSQKADAINQIYKGICEVGRPLSKIIAGSNHVSKYSEDHIEFYETQAEEAHSASCNLLSLLVSYAIYLEEETYQQIADVASESGKVIANFLTVIRQNNHPGLDPDELFDLIEKDRATLKIFEENYINMRYDITKKFRLLLGIEKVSEAK